MTMDFVMDYFGEVLAPVGDAWGFYQGLSAEQQSGVLWLAVVGVAALIVWTAYQAHGDRVMVVLPAGILRIALLLVVLPVVLLGKAAGRGTGVPEFLRRSWTALPDPDGPRIGMEEVNPMKIPGGLSARNATAGQRRANR